MAENDNRQSQLQHPLLDKSGFTISREALMELFVADNMHAKANEPSASHGLLMKEQDGRRGVDRIISQLNSNIKEGLAFDNNEDISKRRKIFGKNARHKRKTRTVCDMICEVFEDFILKVLIVAAIVSTTLGIIQHGVAEGFQEGAGIMFAIIIIVLVTVGNDYSKEKKFQELMAQADTKTVTCIRSGAQRTLDAEELVVGDIVEINYGDSVPADCLVISANDCFCDESALTGEPDELQKEAASETNAKADPFMLQGAGVKKGAALAVVCAVGDNTNQGQAGLSMNIEADETPLQKKLNGIAEGIGKLGVTVAILTLIAIIIKTLISTLQKDVEEGESKFGIDFWKAIANGFVIAITVIVVAVPEGLPLAVTISLAFSVSKMQEEQNLVRKLASSETMGNANEICTDKTGTLTQNKMVVQRALLEHQDFDQMDSSKYSGLASGDLLLELVCMNTTAYYEMKDGAEVQSGNVTELGLLNYLRAQRGQAVDDLIAKRQKVKNDALFTIPLNSERKRHTVVFEKPDGSVRVYCKGAPEVVINFCSNYQLEAGKIAELTDSATRHILDTQTKYAKLTLRTLLVTYRDLSRADYDDIMKREDHINELESNLTVVAMFGLKDPLREGITNAVAVCRRSGINVRMVTGDNIVTAKAISEEAGILSPEDVKQIEADERNFADGEMGGNDDEKVPKTDIAMTGMQFRTQIEGSVVQKKVKKEKDENAEDGEEPKEEVVVEAVIGNMKRFREIAKKLKVMARSQPDDKFMLVDGLIRTGSTVAVTGDGTNDAPALNRADVGFAMGITGTDVAKSACDIQLLDDNFCSILTAVRFGRNIYDNVRKFLQFQLTVNVVAMFIVFAGACIFHEPPLTSTQMLWVNLIMDTFAALALATEPPGPEITGLPAKKSDMIVNSVMWRNIILQSLYQIVWLLLLLFCGGNWFGIVYEDDWPLYPTTDEAVAHNAALVAALPAGQTQVAEGLLWSDDGPTKKVEMYTMCFQSFVFLQLFNQINSRKLGEKECNMFANFFNNWMFIGITLLTFGIQILITQYAGRFMSVVPLTWEQNLWCLAIGVSCMPYSLLTKLVPARWFAWIKLEEREVSTEEAADGFMATVRRQSTIARSKTIGSSRRKQSTRKIQEDDDDFKEDPTIQN